MVSVTDGLQVAESDFTLLVFNSRPYQFQGLLSEVIDPNETTYIKRDLLIRTHVT